MQARLLSVLALLTVSAAAPARAEMAAAGAGSTLSLRAGFDSRLYLSGNKAWLYAEIKGIKDSDDSGRIPLNLSLVLDRSGSMRSEKKLDYLKQACDMLLDNLRPSDYLSVVAYSTDVETLQKSGKLEHKEIVRKKIRDLTPTSSTNLSGGMLRGFEEAKSTRREKYVNRVLLISDGLANQGVVDVGKLQAMAKAKYREDGIAISTFGLGEEYNEDLMTSLAEAGKGNYYFIASPDRIAEIFRKELNGLSSVVAQNVRLRLALPDAGIKVARVHGYDGDKGAAGLAVDFNDVFSEETKAVLIELDLADAKPSMAFEVKLEYDDVDKSFGRKSETLRLRLDKAADSLEHARAKDAEVEKNVVLFQSIDNFEQAVKFVDNQEWDKARTALVSNKLYMDAKFKTLKPDSSLLKQYELNDSYEKGLAEIRTKSARERSLYQKSSKVRSYEGKKKK